MRPVSRGNMMQKSIKRYFPIFVLPTLIAFACFFVVPFLMGIGLSFTKVSTVVNAKWVGFSNYVKAFTYDNEFAHALWFTALFTAVSIITVNILAFALALLLTKGLRGSSFFRAIFFMPNLIGGIVLGYIWNLLINGILLQFDQNLTSKVSYGFWGLVLLTCWQQIGYMMVIYIAAINGVPNEVLESAQIDGESRFKTK